MSSALANLKTTYERTKSKILSKGDADVDDTEYFQEKEKAVFLEQVLVRINKRQKKTLDLFHEMSKLQNEMVTDFQYMYEPNDKSNTTVLLMKEAASNLELERQKMTERIEKNSVKPMDDYCAQFKELKRRMDEYTNRRTEMEKLKNEVAKLQDKGPNAKPKLAAAEDKYKFAVQSYEELREELLHDLPALNDDRAIILGYVQACLLKSQAEFYSTSAEKYNVIAPTVASIDQSSLVHHQHVITTAEASAAASNLRAHPIFNKGEAGGKQSTQAPTNSPTPSSSTLPPQPQVQPVVSLQKQPTQPAASAPPAGDDYLEPLPTVNPFATPSQPPQPQPVQQQPPAQQHQPVQQQPVQQVPPVEESSVLSKPVQAQGLYDFTATEENELSFKKGDILKIVAKHGDWWEGNLNGQVGLLPSNYVREI